MDPWITSCKASIEDMKELLTNYLIKAQTVSTARRIGDEDPSPREHPTKETPEPKPPKASEGRQSGGTFHKTGSPDDDPTFLELSEANNQPATGQYLQSVQAAGLERFMLVDLPLVSLQDVTLEELSAQFASHYESPDPLALLTQTGQQPGAGAGAAASSPGAASSTSPSPSMGRDGSPGGNGKAADAAETIPLPRLTQMTRSLMTSYQFHSNDVYQKGINADQMEKSTQLASKYGSFLKSTLQV